MKKMAGTRIMQTWKVKITCQTNSDYKDAIGETESGWRDLLLPVRLLPCRIGTVPDRAHIR